MYPIHERKHIEYSYNRLESLWEKHPDYHEMTPFISLEELLEKHSSYSEGFEEIKEEYIENDYERFLVQLNWSDLAYRYATKEIIDKTYTPKENSYVTAFINQFRKFDTDKYALFLFPESYSSQFFVVLDVCRRAEEFYPVKNLFPDETKLHYLAVFDKKNMDDVLLMYHLLYTNSSEDLYGGYSLYDYSLPWYHTHLWHEGTVLRSPYLPDYTAKYQGALPYYHNPSKTVYVRRNVEHIIDCGYFSSEVEFFMNLTKIIMPFFQWWYEDISLYEERDGYSSDWRMERTKIRTRLTADGIIRPKWKSELSLFNTVRKIYPDTLYQYRPKWLGRQSLDIYIPSLKTAIEYQGIQHYKPIDFFGGEEALKQRQLLDEQKEHLCKDNKVTLIKWPYTMEPTEDNLKKTINSYT